MQICLLQNLHIFPAFLQNIIREILPYSIPSSLTIKIVNYQSCPVVVLILKTDYTVFYNAYAAFVTKNTNADIHLINATAEFHLLNATAEFHLLNATDEFHLLKGTAKFHLLNATAEFPLLNATAEYNLLNATAQF
jgi:hypothetical protein